MSNIDPRDLEELNKNFNQISRTKKPKLEIQSLDEVHKELHFGKPKMSDDEELPVKVNVSSPTIKKIIPKYLEDNKRIVQSVNHNYEVVKKGDFSKTAISFIPYGGSLINAVDALKYIKSDQKQFKIIQDMYLGINTLEFIVKKIDKIYDLSTSEKQILKNFYQEIIFHKNKIIKTRQHAGKILEKMKDEKFRIKLSTEIQRMFQGTGDLYKYYESFELIDETTKKLFLNRLLNMDYYILKKIKEIISFNQNDVYFRYDEIIEFAHILDARNIITNHFHTQIEKLALSHKKTNEELIHINELLEKIIILAKNYGKNGKYGSIITRSSNLMDKDKNQYILKINNIIEPVITKLQKNALDIETGDYISIELIQKTINSIDTRIIKSNCDEIFQETIKKEIK